MKLDNTEYRSPSNGWHKGVNPQIGGTPLGPYRFKWGRRGTLKIRLEQHNLVAGPNVANSDDFSDDLFILGKANGTIFARCENNKNNEVRLECPAAVPPTLPPYPDK